MDNNKQSDNKVDIGNGLFNDSDMVTIEYNEKEVSVRHMLSYIDMVSFVDFVVDLCFDDNTGEYKPEMRDFAIRYAILKVYTNIYIPENYTDAYRFLYEHEGIFSKIIDVVNDSQFNSIINSIDKRIYSIVDSKTSEIAISVRKLYDALMSFVETVNAQLDGVDPEDIQNVIEAISNSGIDENKFIESYIKNNKTDD